MYLEILNLESDPLATDAEKMGVQVDELTGFSCPELVGGAAEFEMIADIKPTRISVSRPPAAKQSDGGFSVVVGREGNSAECVTIPYTIKSTNQDPISGVVFFDADEKIQKEIKVDFDMVPTEAEEEIFTVCFEQPRGGLKTEIEEQEFSITVSQNVEIPVIDVISVPDIARQR